MYVTTRVPDPDQDLGLIHDPIDLTPSNNLKLRREGSIIPSIIHILVPSYMTIVYLVCRRHDSALSPRTVD